MADIRISKQLEQARAALHDLILGKKAVKLQQNGRSVEFQQTDVEQLRTYISQLETEAGVTSRRRGPAGVR